MRKSLMLLMAGCVCALATVAFAQQGTAEIGGKVTDEQGAILPGVAILVTNEETGVFREVVSGGDGSYFAAQLVPGRYRISAKLAGFRSADRGGLILQVGKALQINLTLGVGGVEETVHVTAESPLVDTTSAKVGGNIGTQELSELPAMNRNFFSTVALLPGVQFAPSNQMGNDTIVAAGQSTQGNNVAIDGGYDSDDALGTSAGAQVRVPLEAIQEFQVITSMYDAEWGRASGAIVNAVTKAGTNQFKGVIFGEAASNTLTAEDYFVANNPNLTKATAVRRDWGGVIGGPIVKNKAHFFVSLERQVDNPNRSRVFPTRPSLDFSIAEDRTDWNTLLRFDHQINQNNTWAIRWLREWAPQWYTVGTKQTLQSTQDETDLDQTAVATLTSVLGNSRVNTVRFARTWEHWWHGNECFRAQGPEGGQEGFVFGNETIGNQALCPPQLNYLSFLSQASTESQGPWDNNLQFEDDYSWFLPGKHGDHDMKFGVRYNYTTLRRVSQVNQNGTFSFNTDLPFNPTNPRTYPERFSIRTGAFEENVKNHTYEIFAQDKWRVTPRTTLNVGVRYDLEIIPLDEADNPLFSGDKNSPTDWNNIAPRISVTHSLDEAGKSVLRGGYGIFYNRTILGAVDDTLEFGKFTTSNVVQFPANAADPGPTAGRFPTDPYLVNGPTVNRTLLNQVFPPGVPVRNNGVVIFDSPNRTLPYAHQFTIGYVRELAASLAINVDYIRAINKDMFLARNLNPALRVDTSRTGALTRSDAFGVLGTPYVQQVWVMENTGDADYNALNLSLEKRYSKNWSGRISYSLSKSTGTGNDQADKNLYQVGQNLNLDAWRGPSNVDRRHILSLGAQTEIPKTMGVTLSATARYMSGAPFTIIDSSIDADRNGELVDPVPAGTYSGTAADSMKDVKYDGGRNGAIGPDYFQLDVRAGWRHKVQGQKVIEMFLDIYNITDRANFDNPTAANSDRRTPANFLVLTNLRGGGGFPRQASMGFRFVF
ncbi:MAG: TonB-dependent receptor [Acidobacteria bacterium]|nr:TonB-dependent receptor [Acidobacteriota bacterium]